MEQINEKFFNVSFAVFDSSSIRVNISQYKSLYKKHLLKSINFTAENFINLNNLKGAKFVPIIKSKKDEIKTKKSIQFPKSLKYVLFPIMKPNAIDLIQNSKKNIIKNNRSII